ncbi:hypothetical protein ACFFIS_02780 [Virgibacillus soli]|uniref:Uncharacterized protein n=1 Tax=Paracerasibacillus soli TaxID=480284 RepID=A0ABU5CRG9_9BACI|nr:hypothetical protein [Virgibacillus soli]MDY0408461.1 hypothetical protein [Virgibacillus soli]
MMHNQRNAIIIKEILFWREHNMLPEVYCNYLLALYSKGESLPEGLPEKRGEARRTYYIQVILLMLLVPFSILVIYFTQFPYLLQLGMLFVFLSYSIWLYRNFKKHAQQWLCLPRIVVMFLIFFYTIFIGQHTFSNEWFILCIVVMNLLGWFVIGMKFKLKQLIYCSFIGGIITLLLLFINHTYNLL